jgi:hypothetical protein
MAETLADIGSRLDQLERELAEMRDMAAIQDVLTRYSRALDWLDDEMLDGVFFDDAEIDYGFFQGTGAAFKPLLMQVERSVGRRWHFTSQLKIDLNGTSAEVESYNLSLGIAALEDNPPSDVMQFFGMYADRLEKRGGQWGIIRRKHLLVAGVSAKEITMTGEFGQLNKLGATGVTHQDYRRLAELVSLPGVPA